MVEKKCISHKRINYYELENSKNINSAVFFSRIQFELLQSKKSLWYKFDLQLSTITDMLTKIQNINI